MSSTAFAFFKVTRKWTIEGVLFFLLLSGFLQFNPMSTLSDEVVVFELFSSVDDPQTQFRLFFQPRRSVFGLKVVSNKKVSV